MSTFKLVVRGEILPGYETDTVKADIARLLKLEDGSKHIADVFSGRLMRLRSGLKRKQAEKYQAAIQNAGLGCEVIAETVGAPVEASRTVSASREKTAGLTESNDAPAQSASDAESRERDESYNPYQQPQADLTVDAEAGEFDLVEPKKLNAGAGWGWLREGFYYFKQSPLLWIGSVLLVWLITAAMSMIPFVSIIVNLISPVFMAGFMVAVYKQFQGEAFSISDMFVGFKNNTGRLVAVGALYLLGIILCIIAAFVTMYMLLGGMQGIAAIGQSGVPPDPIMMSVVVLVMFALLTPMLMAYWFAPALVMLNEVSPVSAMRLSFKGCLRNWLPFLVYGIVGFVLMFVAILPVFLGLFVLVPVGIASIFASYRQIYTNTELI